MSQSRPGAPRPDLAGPQRAPPRRGLQNGATLQDNPVPAQQGTRPGEERRAPGSRSIVWQRWLTRADIDVDNDTNQRDRNEATRSQPPRAGNAAARIRKANVRAALFKKPEPVRIGRFTLLERLGAGAMGEVYAAYDEQLDRKVALKLVRSSARDSERADERLLREAQTLAQVSHPNVVQVYEAGTHDGGVFIAMEFIRGKTLTAWLGTAEELPRPERQREILRQFIAAGRGLEAAHAAGLAHRDFKPDNVLVGDDDRVRVVDFGLARLVADTTAASGTTAAMTTGSTATPAQAPAGEATMQNVAGLSDEDTWDLGPGVTPPKRADADPTRDMEPPATRPRQGSAVPDRELLSVESTEAATPAPELITPAAPSEPARPGEPGALRKAALRLTDTGMVMGTPRYMAPEQMRGQVPDHRSDQFSFCVSLFHALYGEWPFHGSNALDLMRAAARGKLVQPKNQADVPAPVRKAIVRGLSAGSEARFANMGELLQVLESWLQRRRRGLWRFAAAALMTGTAVAFAAVGQVPEPCEGVTGEIDALWSPERKEKLGRAFRDSGQVYADTAWLSTGRVIDEYVTAWRGGARDACEAAQVRQTQSSELFDRRMLCLGRGRQRLEALLTSFDPDTAPLDTKVIEKALDAASELPDLAVCRDAEAMSQGLEPPADPALARSVADVRQRLAEAYTARLLGRYDEALRAAEKQLVEARKLDYPPLHAEALFHVGIARAVRALNSDTDQAADAYLEAVDIAEGVRHDQLAADIWHRLVLLAAQFDSSVERGHAWSRREQAAVRRIGDPPQARAQALETLGRLYAKDSKHAEAVEQYEKAAEILQAIQSRSAMLASVYHAWANSESARGDQGKARWLFGLALNLSIDLRGDKHPAVARIRNDLARVLLELEDFDRARELLQAALTTSKQVHGPVHYLVAKIFFSLAVVEYQTGNFDQARAYAEDGRRIYADEYEPDHRYQAEPHIFFGLIDLRQGNFVAAQRAFEQALAIQRRHLDERHSLIHLTRYYLGETLVGLKRYDAALEQYRIIEASMPDGASIATDLHALLLSVRGRALLGRGDVDPAIEVLEQAVSRLRDLPGLSWERAATLWALARALRAGGTDAEARALSLAEEARDIHAARGPTDAQMRDAITDWLDEHDPR
jgi:serine/threonine protein kinase/tetratricopeptide (TPR) repeat protein